MRSARAADRRILVRVEHRRTDPDHLLEPSWILPEAPAGYGGPGVIHPYSNLNPMNPMASEMQARAEGSLRAAAPTAPSTAAAPGARAEQPSGPLTHYAD